MKQRRVKQFIYFFAIILLNLIITVAAAEDLQPLPLDKAFTLTLHFDGEKQITVTWTVAPGYYLYRDQMEITTHKLSQVKLGQINWPVGQTKQDNLRGKHQVYNHDIHIVVPLDYQKGKNLDLLIHYQGCSSNGFCYAPVNRTLNINLASIKPPANITSHLFTATIPLPPSEQDYVANLFSLKSYGIVLLSFLGLGLLLAFTPCVLPMVPILSAIIMGHRHKSLTTMKSFLLSLAYVLGMAITYAIAGIAVALVGSHLQTELQRPWVIVIFSALFVIMGGSLLGLYSIKLPSRWQQTLTTLSNRQKGGTYIGVFLMGSISSLIVSPCITPPLVGTLAYIAQTGNVWLGGCALFFLGIGMGIPLLLLGASAGKLLPKVGSWMQSLERFMGVLMLAFAIWMLSRIIPGAVTLFLWSILFIAVGFYLIIFSKIASNKRVWKRTFGLIALIYGVILMIGSLLGNKDPLHPWENVYTTIHENSPKLQSNFVTPKNMKQLDNLLKAAKKNRRYVFMDFYADWCASCVRMERYVFNRKDVIEAMEGYVLLRIDITNNNSFDRAVLKRFNVIAPPTFIFFNNEGQELLSEQRVGEVDAKKLIADLTRIKKESESAN